MKHNFVAKNAAKTNKCIIFKDKKKARKKGELKHKGKRLEPYSIAV